MEGRSPAKGNTEGQNVPRTQRRTSTNSALDRVREAARKDKKQRFTALLHHVTIDRLRQAYLALARRAAAGIDGVTWIEYGQGVEARLADLHARVQRGAYRAKPSRRVYIPKPDGRRRPPGIAAVEDKILQRAVVEVLNAIYENDFLGFSYGFRPGRSQHQALDALATAIMRKKVNWVLDADIRGFFDTIDHGWLVKFIEHRIADKRIVRLIQKWLAAGVLEDGMWSSTEVGTPQGATISPLLANIYLHYVRVRPPDRILRAPRTCGAPPGAQPDRETFQAAGISEAKSAGPFRASLGSTSARYSTAFTSAIRQQPKIV